MKSRVLLVLVLGLLTTMIVALEFQLHYAQSEFAGMSAVTDELVFALFDSANHARAVSQPAPKPKTTN